jgi:hypothetical protein
MTKELNGLAAELAAELEADAPEAMADYDEIETYEEAPEVDYGDWDGPEAPPRTATDVLIEALNARDNIKAIMLVVTTHNGDISVSHEGATLAEAYLMAGMASHAVTRTFG